MTSAWPPNEVKHLPDMIAFLAGWKARLETADGKEGGGLCLFTAEDVRRFDRCASALVWLETRLPDLKRMDERRRG